MRAASSSRLFRGLKAGNHAMVSKVVDKVYSFPGHLCLVLHQARELVLLDQVVSVSECMGADLVSFVADAGDRKEAATRAGLLYEVFSEEVVEVHFVLEGETLQLLVLTCAGVLHCWLWDVDKVLWGRVAPQRLGLSPGARLVAAQVERTGGTPSFICLEDRNECHELTLSRCSVKGAAESLASVPADGVSAQLFLERSGSHTWVWSRYAGLCCVHLATGEFDAPTQMVGALVLQHPLSREVLSVQTDGSVTLFNVSKTPQDWPFFRPRLLCRLATSVSGLRDAVLMHQCLWMLDEDGARCSLFDLLTGTLIHTFASPPHSRFASSAFANAVSAVALWGTAAGVQQLEHPSIEALEALLPPERGTGLARAWKLPRLAAWRILSSLPQRSAELCEFTGSPALAVALAEDEESEELLQVTRRYLEEKNPVAAFQAFSSISGAVRPLLEDWAHPQLPTLEYGEMDAMETLQLSALETSAPERIPLDLVDDERFVYQCRVIFEHEPENLMALVEQHGAKFALAASVLPTGRKDPPLSEVQVTAAAQVLVRADMVASAARLLIAYQMPQTLNFHLAFAEAIRTSDEARMEELWRGSQLDVGSLLRMFQVYGEAQEKPARIGLLAKLLK